MATTNEIAHAEVRVGSFLWSRLNTENKLFSGDGYHTGQNFGKNFSGGSQNEKPPLNPNWLQTNLRSGHTLADCEYS